jgi:hypothetical protein
LLPGLPLLAMGGHAPVQRSVPRGRRCPGLRTLLPLDEDEDELRRSMRKRHDLAQWRDPKKAPTYYG